MKRYISTLIRIAAALVAVSGLCHAEASGRAVARRMTEAPVVDGVLTEWNTFPQVEMTEPAVPDLKVERSVLGWTDDALHVAFRVMDKAVVNNEKFDRLDNGDCFEIRIVSPVGNRNTFLRVLVAPSSA